MKDWIKESLYRKPSLFGFTYIFTSLDSLTQGHCETMAVLHFETKSRVVDGRADIKTKIDERRGPVRVGGWMGWVAIGAFGLVVGRGAGGPKRREGRSGTDSPQCWWSLSPIEHAANFPVNTWVSQQRCAQNKWLPCSRRNHTLSWFRRGLRGQRGQVGRPPLWGFWGQGWIWLGGGGREVERGERERERVASRGWEEHGEGCLSSQNGNIRARTWQPLSLFIVDCLPAPGTVNNGTPSLWALCSEWPQRSGCGES